MANLNTSNPAIKRILSEVKKLESEPSPDFEAHPVEDNLFDWHFVLRGPEDTPFEGGLFHGRIILPAQYPFQPPEFMFLCPQGRFEVGKKICLSISQHHPELWQPGWDIRTALTAIQSFMPTPGNGAIAALDYSDEERRKLALQSKEASKNSLRACDMLDSFTNILTKERPASSGGAAAAGGAAASGGAAHKEPASQEKKNEEASQRPPSEEEPAANAEVGPQVTAPPGASDEAKDEAAAPSTEKKDGTADEPFGLRHRKPLGDASPKPTKSKPAAASTMTQEAQPAQEQAAAAGGGSTRPSYAPHSYAPNARAAVGGAAQTGAAVGRGGSARSNSGLVGRRVEPELPPSDDEKALISLANFLIFCIVALVGRRALITLYPEVDWSQESVVLFRQFCQFIDSLLQGHHP